MQNVIEVLNKSGVILTPTDTTFGLSCLALDEEAVQKVNIIKKRPIDKRFILIVDNEARLQRYVDVPDLAWDLIDLSEKPITLIYDKILDLPNHLISSDGTVAIRLCKYQPLQRIIQKVRQPLVSTSANIANAPTPTSFESIDKRILEDVDYIMPESQNFIPRYDSSSIIRISHDHKIKVIRA